MAVKPYEKWTQSFTELINDDEGKRLFIKYLEEQDSRPEHHQCLMFWYAINGFRQEGDRSVQLRLFKSLVKWFKNDIGVFTSEKTRQAVKSAFDEYRNHPAKFKISKHVFDDAQAEIEHELSSKPYRTFLKSDLFIEAVQLAEERNRLGHMNLQPPLAGSSSSVYLERHSLPAPDGFKGLAEVPEDSELTTKTQMSTFASSQSSKEVHFFPSRPNVPPAIRPRSQVAMQKAFDVAPSTAVPIDAFRRQQYFASYHKSKSMSQPPNPYHTDYATVIPNSAQDSEVQSKSTDTDASSYADGMDLSTKRISTREKFRDRENKRQNLLQNSGLCMSTGSFVPKTEQPVPVKPGPNAEKDFKAFAELLNSKLEAYLQEPDSKRKLEKKLNSIDETENDAVLSNEPKVRQMLTEALESVEKPNEDNDQAILDQHFMRVFDSETPDGDSARSIREARRRKADRPVERELSSRNSLGKMDPKYHDQWQRDRLVGKPTRDRLVDNHAVSSDMRIQTTAINTLRPRQVDYNCNRIPNGTLGRIEPSVDSAEKKLFRTERELHTTKLELLDAKETISALRSQNEDLRLQLEQLRLSASHRSMKLTREAQVYRDRPRDSVSSKKSASLSSSRFDSSRLS
ncbi:Axin-1 [Halotydeus destructor]|nr:Axin-1 [Halotydeus destructor]